MRGAAGQANPSGTQVWRKTKPSGDTKPSGARVRREKPLGSESWTVPQTDTGRWVEDTKAGEITLVKELGKLTP